MVEGFKLETRRMKISDIIISDRLRSIDEKKVAELAKSIEEIGLINPVSINTNNELRAGLHRIEAFKLLGKDEIDVIIIENIGKLQEELIEIDENLIRAELGYIERGDFLKRRKEIYEELYPETKVGQYGHKGTRIIEKPENGIIPFSVDTANKTGKSESTIQQEVQISTVLDDTEKKIIKDVDLPKIETLKYIRLKKKDPEKAKKVLSKIESEETYKVDVAKSVVESEDISNIVCADTFDGTKTLYTIGYSGKTIETFIQLLKKNNISLLIDVRDSGKSIYKQEFESSSLQQSLERNGINYKHVKEMGVVYEVREPYKDGYITNDAFKQWYKWNIDKWHRSEFLELLEFITTSEKNSCLMCSEEFATPNDKQSIVCHRSILADEVFKYRDISNVKAIVESVTHL